MIQGEAMPTIGLIGLGNAGRPIAERIVAKGYSLAVYDLNPGAVERLARLGAHRVNSAREAVRDITLTVLPSSAEVRQAVFGKYGALSAINSSVTFIDLSGTDPDCARDVENRLGEK
ncbi:MAG: 2-hydroxy-3-oxopropionate reductase, partial [Deltaproteobacteria bacterium]